MRIHVAWAREMPRTGQPFETTCKTKIGRAEFPFSIEGDVRNADVMLLGNCWTCRKDFKAPAEGKYVVFGVTESVGEVEASK